MADAKVALNIYQRINAVMATVEYVQKDTVVQGQNYKALSRDAVVAHIRPALVKFGIVVTTSTIDRGPVELTGAKTSNGATYIRYHGYFEVRFTNIDDPKDFVAVNVEAHGLDTGDKACGKAATLAEKQQIVKTFLLEAGLGEESRYDIELPDEPPAADKIKPPEAAAPASEPTASSQSPALAENASPAAAGTATTSSEDGKKILALIELKGDNAKKMVKQAMANAKVKKLTDLPAKMSAELLPALAAL